MALCKGKQLKTCRNTLFVLANHSYNITHKYKYFKISLVFSHQNYILVGFSETLKRNAIISYWFGNAYSSPLITWPLSVYSQANINERLLSQTNLNLYFIYLESVMCELLFNITLIHVLKVTNRQLLH